MWFFFKKRYFKNLFLFPLLVGGVMILRLHPVLFSTYVLRNLIVSGSYNFHFVLQESNLQKGLSPFLGRLLMIA